MGNNILGEASPSSSSGSELNHPNHPAASLLPCGSDRPDGSTAAATEAATSTAATTASELEQLLQQQQQHERLSTECSELSSLAASTAFDHPYRPPPCPLPPPPPLTHPSSSLPPLMNPSPAPLMHPSLAHAQPVSTALTHQYHPPTGSASDDSPRPEGVATNAHSSLSASADAGTPATNESSSSFVSPLCGVVTLMGSAEQAATATPTVAAASDVTRTGTTTTEEGQHAATATASSSLSQSDLPPPSSSRRGQGFVVPTKAPRNRKKPSKKGPPKQRCGKSSRTTHSSSSSSAVKAAATQKAAATKASKAATSAGWSGAAEELLSPHPPSMTTMTSTTTMTRNGGKSSSKRSSIKGIKSNKRNSTSTTTSAAIIPIPVEDAAPYRIVNPLVDLPRVSDSSSSSLPLCASDLWQLLDVVFPVPDTYSIAYLARVLGYRGVPNVVPPHRAHVPVQFAFTSLMGSNSNTSTSNMEELIDACYQIPKFPTSSGRLQFGEDTDEARLGRNKNHWDPFYTILLDDDNTGNSNNNDNEGLLHVTTAQLTRLNAALNKNNSNKKAASSSLPSPLQSILDLAAEYGILTGHDVSTLHDFCSNEDDDKTERNIWWGKIQEPFFKTSSSNSNATTATNPPPSCGVVLHFYEQPVAWASYSFAWYPFGPQQYELVLVLDSLQTVASSSSSIEQQQLDDSYFVVLTACVLEHARLCHVHYAVAPLLWQPPQQQQAQVVTQSEFEGGPPPAAASSSLPSPEPSSSPPPFLETCFRMTRSNGRLVCDLHKCSSRYAFLKYRELQRQQQQQQPSTSSSNINNGTTATALVVSRRWLVQLPTAQELQKKAPPSPPPPPCVPPPPSFNPDASASQELQKKAPPSSPPCVPPPPSFNPDASESASEPLLPLPAPASPAAPSLSLFPDPSPPATAAASSLPPSAPVADSMLPPPPPFEVAALSTSTHPPCSLLQSFSAGAPEAPATASLPMPTEMTAPPAPAPALALALPARKTKIRHPKRSSAGLFPTASSGATTAATRPQLVLTSAPVSARNAVVNVKAHITESGEIVTTTVNRRGITVLAANNDHNHGSSHKKKKKKVMMVDTDNLQIDILRDFEIPRQKEAHQQHDNDAADDDSCGEDEILKQLKSHQAALRDIETAVHPQIHALMGNIILERIDFEKQVQSRREDAQILEQYQRKLERRKQQEMAWQKQLEQDMDAVCDVCNDGEVTPSNPILFCDGCGVAVHRFCYGIDRIPEGDYYCLACHYLGRSRSSVVSTAPKLVASPLPIVCELCPRKLGAFIRTDVKNVAEEEKMFGKWVHAVCAKWQGLNFVTEPDLVEDVTELKVAFRRNGIQCHLCQGERGCMNKCSASDCDKWLHVTCARAVGTCEVIHGEDVRGSVTNNPWSLMCPEHSTIKEVPTDATSIDSLIQAAKEFPPEPVPPPVTEWKPFNTATGSERKVLLQDPKYERSLITELTTKKLFGARCDVCDGETDPKFRTRCHTCGIVFCKDCGLVKGDGVDGNGNFRCARCLYVAAKEKACEEYEEPSCITCYKKSGLLRKAFAKPFSRKSVCAMKKGGYESTLFGKQIWVHTLCTYWCPKLMVCQDTGVVDCSNVVMNTGRGLVQAGTQCFLCGNNGGLKVKCYHEACAYIVNGKRTETFFHVTCARMAGLEVSTMDVGSSVIFYVKCYRHGGNEYNLRAKMEDMLEIEKRRSGKQLSKSEAPMSFAHSSRLLHSALGILRVLGWAWQWAEQWVDYNSSWEPLLEPGEREEDMTKEELRIVDSTRESRCQDARACRLSAFGAALRNRSFDTEDDFDRDSFDHAIRSILQTKSLVGPLQEFEIDFYSHWLALAYWSKSRSLGFGDDKIEVNASSCFCLTMKDQSPKFLLNSRALPGSSPDSSYEESDNFLLTEVMLDEELESLKRASSPSKRATERSDPACRTRSSQRRPQRGSLALSDESAKIDMTDETTVGILPASLVSARSPRKPKSTVATFDSSNEAVAGMKRKRGGSSKRAQQLYEDDSDYSSVVLQPKRRPGRPKRIPLGGVNPGETEGSVEVSQGQQRDPLKRPPGVLALKSMQVGDHGPGEIDGILELSQASHTLQEDTSNMHSPELVSEGRRGRLKRGSVAPGEADGTVQLSQVQESLQEDPSEKPLVVPSSKGPRGRQKRTPVGFDGAGGIDGSVQASQVQNGEQEDDSEENSALPTTKRWPSRPKQMENQGRHQQSSNDGANQWSPRSPKRTMRAPSRFCDDQAKSLIAGRQSVKGAGASPKRRGRPPKSPRVEESQEVADELEPLISGRQSAEGAGAFPKRRGRPPKNPRAEESKVPDELEPLIAGRQSAEGAGESPKRRGRPPKRPRVEESNGVPEVLKPSPHRYDKEAVRLARRPARYDKEEVKGASQPVVPDRSHHRYDKEAVSLARRPVMPDRSPHRYEKEAVKRARRPVVPECSEHHRYDKEAVKLARRPPHQPIEGSGDDVGETHEAPEQYAGSHAEEALSSEDDSKSVKSFSEEAVQQSITAADISEEVEKFASRPPQHLEEKAASSSGTEESSNDSPSPPPFPDDEEAVAEEQSITAADISEEVEKFASRPPQHLEEKAARSSGAEESPNDGPSPPTFPDEEEALALEQTITAAGISEEVEKFASRSPQHLEKAAASSSGAEESSKDGPSPPTSTREEEVV